MKILLTGKDGQLGCELRNALSASGTLLAVGRKECDLARPESICALLREFKPEVVVNAAAYTAVDKAESEVAEATAVNAVLPGVLGEEAARLGAWVLHFSTDYVFDGAKPTPYVEDDVTHPLNVYGRTKRDGELALQASGARCLIFRASWVAGAKGNNFAKSILRLASEREQLSVVADQFGVPTPAVLLAQISATMLGRASAAENDSFPFGLYHLVPGGETNWHEYAVFVLKEAQKLGKTFKIRPEDVRPIPASDYPAVAKRPANSRLETARFRRTFGIDLPDWKPGIRNLVGEMLRNS